jgi:hypothetical protein
METPVFPRARHARLTVRELPDETLVYDQERHKGHCLNATAALVWRHCDGKTSLDELARRVARELRLGRGREAAAAELVGLALEQLGRRHLLDEAPAPLPEARRLSRRDALKKLALAAVLPLVMTVATRTAAESLSGMDPPEDPPPNTSTPPITVQVPVGIQVGGSGNTSPPPAPAPKQTPAPPPAPCRTQGQSCLAAASGQQGTCCQGSKCNGVAQGAGVCG